LISFDIVSNNFVQFSVAISVAVVRVVFVGGGAGELPPHWI